jgi:uncharacterized protein YndB with AHSA1/START domain
MKPAEVTTPSDTTVMVKRIFDAEARLVWRAYTEPAVFTRWCTSPPWSMPVCEMDVRPGGKYRWRWRNHENGNEFGFAGEFREIEKHRKIVHTQVFDPGNTEFAMGDEGTLITVTFDEQDGVTTVVTLMAYSSKEDRDEALSTGMTEGMEMNYKQLDGILLDQDQR